MTETPRILRRDARHFTPWKNGGGRTAEILIMPEGAGIDTFDWRISTAEVAQSGPFSEFPGIDRWLTVLEGGAMVLTLPERRIRIAPGAKAIHFQGDAPCSAVLEGPPLLDLNIMTRRPLSARIGDTPSSDAVLARYALALAPVPALGLMRHDLLIASPDATPESPLETLLWIEIFSGS